MGSFLDLVSNNWVGIVNLLTQIVGAFAIVAAWTPNTVDNRIATHFNRAANR